MQTLLTGLFKKNRGCGFTLIELLVVLVIMGLFSAIVSLRIEGGIVGGDLRLASRMIIGEIKNLRGKAAYTHKNQTLEFNIEKNIFYPVEPETAEEGLSGLVFEDKEYPLNSRRLPEGVQLEDVVILTKGKIQEGEAIIRFFPNGCVDRSLIHLRNEKGEVYTLEINPITGQVRIYDRYIDQEIEE